MFGQMASYSKVKVGGVAVKGVDVRKVRPGVVPLFLLKKSVTVKSRVFPEEQLAWIKPIVLDGFKRAKIE